MIITLAPGSGNWIMTAGVRKMMTTMKRMRRIQLSTQIGVFMGEEESQSAATSPSLMRHQCRHTPTFRKLSMVLLSQFTTLPLPGDQKGLKKYRPGGRKSKRIALQIFFFLSIIQSISVRKKSVFSLVYLSTPMMVGGGGLAQWVEGVAPDKEVPGLIPAVAARSLLVGSVSV